MRFQNLHLADRSLFNQYRAMFPTDIEDAHLILTNSQLNNKVILADDINNITNDITTLENSYKTNIPDVLQSLLATFNENIGHLINVGDYNSATNYKENNIVLYNGAFYFCLQESIGHTPTDTTYWLYLGLKGQEGSNGIEDWATSGLWFPELTGPADLIVGHNNALWVSTQNFPTNTEPTEDSAYWKKIISYEPKEINLDDTALNTGDIYWEILT